MSALFQQFLQKASSKFAPVNRNHHYRRNSDGREFDSSSYGAALKRRRGQMAEHINYLRDHYFKNKNKALSNERKANSQAVTNQRNTALAAFDSARADLGKQADAQLSSPLSAPVTVPVQAPINQVNDVGTDAALAGTNAATSAFFINPESTQSQFAVGAPTGGGGIGQRQRGQASAGPESDTLGVKKKDKL